MRVVAASTGFFLKLLLRYDLRQALNRVVRDEPDAVVAGSGPGVAPDVSAPTRRAGVPAARAAAGQHGSTRAGGESDTVGAGEQAALEWATVLPSKHLCQAVPPFFAAGMVAYVGSLVLTHVIMTAFQSAQVCTRRRKVRLYSIVQY